MVPFSQMDDVVLVIRKVGAHSHDVFFKINGVDHDNLSENQMWGCGYEWETPNEGKYLSEAIGKAYAIAFECKAKPVKTEYREWNPNEKG